MNKKKLIFSLLLNIFTFLSVLICMIFILKNGKNPLRMFTNQTNLIAGIVSLIIIVFEILILFKKLDKLPKIINIIKMISTTGVTLTLLVVVFYLGFVAIHEGYSYFILFKGANLFFHFLTPLSAIISFIFFESNSGIKKRYTFLNLLHMISYTIFYAINVFSHLTADGKVQRKYDWYYFINGENWTFIIVGIIMILATYLIGFLLWLLNKKIANKNYID